jgi:hypothetical protein
LSKVHRIEQKTPNDPEFAFFCPGCQCAHCFKTTGSNPRWNFNGDVDRPTITPSIRTFGSDSSGKELRCHSYVADGSIQFLADCSHKLAGKKVALEEF